MRHLAVAVAATFVAAAATPASAVLVVNPTTIGQSVIVQSTNDVIARFESQTATLSSNLFLVGRAGVIFNNQSSAVGATVNLGSFAVGTELVFRIETSDANAFFTGPGSRNPDGLPHAAVNTDAGRTFVGFEDLLNGGDQDYNDLVFSFSNTAATVGSVPEPATWGLMLAGFGLVGAGLRARRRSTAVTFA